MSTSGRKRRSRRGGDPVVAPGGGTQADVNNLSRQLGMRTDAVHAILNCQGAGVEAVRSNRRSGATSSVTNETAATSTAWADFMSEEGFGSNKKEKEEDVGDERNKRSRRESAPKKAITITGARDYTLPIKPRMRLGDRSDDDDGEYVEPGILAQTGSLDSTMPGRSKRPLTLEKVDLQAPTLLMYESIFAKTPVAFIATSSSSCHSICIDTFGMAYAWGRNESGQCGTGAISDCIAYPTRVGESKFVGAAVGKSHSILIEADTGVTYAAGSNKVGQCGVNHKIETILNFRKCFLAGNENQTIIPVQASCGEQFSVLLTDKGHIYSSGSAEYGQLGNGETGEYFVAANKISFANGTKFERRGIFVQTQEEADAAASGTAPSNISTGDDKKMVPLPDSVNIVIASISCGKNHAIAVEAASTSQSPRVFSWGCGDYGCLGHNIQADEYTPRLVTTLSGPMFATNVPTRAAAGGSCSMILTKHGHVYYWGKHRSVGEATMRPNLVEVLANNMHNVTTLSGGFQTVFCSTNNGVTVSWGNGPIGELGYGKDNPKSSSKPKFVEKLDTVLVTDVQCGYGHTLFLLRNKDDEDKKAVENMAKVETDDLVEFIKVLSSSGKTNVNSVVVSTSSSATTGADTKDEKKKPKGRPKKK
uniref:Uncharacterized protein n=1 Tax=Eucampia antarctica TaxID=49252 RepID=A0A7S2S1V5_9STRA|mmetsp:Transcript_29842/g.28716  ORF Transcript_29842/g.28716 Transcript_29842/m.28716 type:complete len:648 (+) Transcript_29842:121-2064(+)|eukprot:CAMPEP_0197832040 /NCGR_PEP_ID=MMETSP1437-20131217/13003_1 /TAXON_ID=49252 ORGANISM="Eucampia antarctica, Strain CCMP1452" /NCGR_SAMPLE_ID=MMETSP1437 /ASSEMBLY_ACC=CAM_ASM_001096 /LENGTH=647 /DNA_ID=CAMNT_0043435207 /DNA_START=110 /DNA_END=2053 /DNA_ORIENTATION=+